MVNFRDIDDIVLLNGDAVVIPCIHFLLKQDCRHAKEKVADTSWSCFDCEESWFGQC